MRSFSGAHRPADTASQSRAPHGHRSPRPPEISFGNHRASAGLSARIAATLGVQVHTDSAAGSIRRLAISPTKTFTQGKCGKRSVFWNFASDVAAPASGGYIVQHVRNLETLETCPKDVTAVSTQPTDQFWEAWWVAPGDKIQELHKNGEVDFTDTSNLSSKEGAGKSGHQATLGTVKFFGKDTTGDLGKEDVLSSDKAIASVWKPGTKGGVAMAHWLPSTRTEPSWWGNALDGPASRWANSWWNCCGTDKSKHWSESDASPK